MTKMKKISGLPFLRAHHHLARIGILLILIHPFTFVLQGRGIQIFSPISPTNIFIALGGRPALYLFLLAAGIALYRKKYKNWRKIHYFSYLAFLLVTVHALMLGDDFELIIMRILAITMAVTVIAIFIHKRSAPGQKRKQTIEVRAEARFSTQQKLKIYKIKVIRSDEIETSVIVGSIGVPLLLLVFFLNLFKILRQDLGAHSLCQL